MHEKHSNRGAENVNYASTLPDDFEETSNECARRVMKTDSRVMEFLHDSGAALTLYEKHSTGYVGCLMSTEQETMYYEVDPSTVVYEENEWPDSDCQLVELAVLPLLDADWLLTYYDEEHTKKKMYQLFNGDRLV